MNLASAPSDATRRLLWHGALLFFVGLLQGVAVPYFLNPRMGLSAHLTAVQNGMALFIFGLAWTHLHLSSRLARTAFVTALYGMYSIWFALTLAAIFGTSRATPIAGAGFSGAPWQEILVYVVITSGSVALIVTGAIVLFGLRRSVQPTGADGLA